MASPTPYAFVQQGSFSGINASLRAALDPALGRPSVLVDTHDYRRLAPGSLLNTPARNLRAHVREHRHVLRADPRAFVARRLETSFMFAHRSAVARAGIRAADAPFALQTMTMFNAKTDDRPLFIYTDHTMLANRRYGAFSVELRGRGGWIELERRAYADADLIFTISEFARGSLIEDYGCRPEQVVVARSGANSPVPADPTEHRDVPRTVAFVGKQWERKGGPTLVEAFRRAREAHPQLELVVAGCSPELSEPGVTVLGPVSQERVGEILRDADVFAMPSTLEPSAIVYSEAAAFSLPVLATTVGGTPERVLDGETGLLSPPGDADRLARNLLRLVEEPGLADRLGLAGQRLAADHFTWAATARTIADAIDERVGHSRPR